MRRALLVLAMLAVAASAHSESRDISMFGAVFQWFEAAVEMVFAYFTEPSQTSNANGVGIERSSVAYRNYQVFRVRPATVPALEEIEGLVDEPGLEFWTMPMKNRSTDILVSPELTDYMKEYLTERDIDFAVLSNNLEADIKKQNPKVKRGEDVQSKTARQHPLTWSRYHSAKDIEAYLDYLANLEPSLVSLITIGMHGREWIAPAVSLFILRQLVENYATNRNVVDSVDWFIMPLANPDGYEYTHKTDRFWRKNRSKKVRGGDSDDKGRLFWGDDEDERCGGVDLNRNFDYHWGEAGSSDNPCGPTYAGPRPFSEPETKAIADFLLDTDRMKAYLTLHSYSQMWLLPWGYTKQAAKDHDDLMYVGRRAIEALKKVHGTSYQIGSSPQLLYPTSGSSDDWAKGRAGIKYSYTIELRDKGTYGFLLPASQIIPTGRETFAAVKTIAKHIASSNEQKLSS